MVWQYSNNDRAVQDVLYRWDAFRYFEQRATIKYFYILRIFSLMAFLDRSSCGRISAPAPAVPRPSSRECCSDWKWSHHKVFLLIPRSNLFFSSVLWRLELLWLRLLTLPAWLGGVGDVTGLHRLMSQMGRTIKREQSLSINHCTALRSQGFVLNKRNQNQL